MVKYPLYKGAEPTSLNAYPERNQGLVFSRFFNRYNDDFTVNSDSKREFLSEFSELNGGLCGDDKAIERSAQRQLSLATAMGGQGVVYQTQGHFVTGMGIEHPVENGFLWHHTLGTPYLSGSQVKGLVRSLLERYLDPADQPTLLKKWFGSADKKDVDTEAGALIFFDALPVKRPQLVVEIMTPHMGDWYANGGNLKTLKEYKKIPSDWHEPTPIPFLVVKKAQFLFTIAPRAGSDINMDEVFDCLDKALATLGAGAKTQTGFGVMLRDEKATTDLAEETQSHLRELQEQQVFEKSVASASDLEKELRDLARQKDLEAQNDTAKGHFNNLLEEWLEKLEAAPEEASCIQYFETLARVHFPAQMKNPNGKKTKENQRKWILRLLTLVESSKAS